MMGATLTGYRLDKPNEVERRRRIIERHREREARGELQDGIPIIRRNVEGTKK